MNGITLLTESDSVATNGGSLHLNLAFNFTRMSSSASNRGTQIGVIVLSPLAAVEQEQSQTAAAVTGGAAG